MKKSNGEMADLTREECFGIHEILMECFDTMLSVYGYVVNNVNGDRRNYILDLMNQYMDPLLDTCDQLTNYVKELG